MQDLVDTIRSELDDICRNMTDTSDPEWHKLNCVRFVEHYILMREMERRIEKENTK